MKLIKITKESGIPLIGVIAFAIIDRGSNLIQIRPTTVCNLSCVFCSTDAGENSKFHPYNYEVDVEYLLEWIKEIVEFKGEGTEINIDSVGEATCYKDLIKLIKGIKEIKGIERISMQSNGTLLTKEKIKELEKAGLNRINLSLHSLNEERNKFLTNCENYNTKHVLEAAELINKSKIELLLAPVFIPKNDEDIERIIELSKKLNCKIGIQKYEIHRYGRKIKNVKEMTFWKFYKKLDEWERKFNVKLKLGPYDFNIKRTKRIPKIFNKNEITNVEIKIPGWIRNELIGIGKNRCITIINSNAKINQKIKVKIIDDKNEIYIAKSL